MKRLQRRPLSPPATPFLILFLALAALLRPAAAEPGDPRSVPSEAAALPALIDVAGPLDGVYLFDKALIARSGGDMTPDGDGWQLLTPDRLDQGYTGDDFLVRFGLINSGETPAASSSPTTSPFSIG